MAIGDLVGTISLAGLSSETFSLSSNPGGLFAISGSNLIEAIDLADGSYPITLQAFGPGGAMITQSFVVIFSIDTLITDTGDTIVTDTGDTRIVVP